jgi:hypothetical protein
VIDLIDPIAGRLIASKRFPFRMEGIAGRDLIYLSRIADDGFISVDVARVRLNSNPNK